MKSREFIAFGILAALCGCGTSSSSPITRPVIGPVPHLYVADQSGNGSISQYSLPLASGETPAASIVTVQPGPIAVDTLGDVVLRRGFGEIERIAAPFTSASTPTAEFAINPGPGASQLTYLGTTLYNSTYSSTVNQYTMPFANATPTSISLSGSAATVGIAFDTAGTLYASNALGAAYTGPSNLYALASPYTGTPIVTPVVTGAWYRQVTVCSGSLFVGEIAPSPGGIDAYQLPLTASSTPAFTITNGVNDAATLACDPSGNLYAGNAGNATVTVYSRPFSASSAPVATLTLPSGADISGVAVGL